MIVREVIGLPIYAAEVEEGLTGFPKTLPSKLFYDARGSELFEEITALPEYYPTRTELEILKKHSRDIAAAAGSGVSVIELGAGTAAKTTTLLQAMAASQLRVNYFPVDISRTALSEARKRIRTEVPQALVQPVVADFSEGFEFLREMPAPRLVLYLGSSIGNFDPESARTMLTEVRAQMTRGDSLLLGTDLAKAKSVLVPAYDDKQGVTAAFNRNILWRINRELGGNFDPDSFAHAAIWNPRDSRIEMHLRSTRPQTVRIQLLGLDVHFAAGETIHTENSYKYTVPMVRDLLEQSGFALDQTWMDKRKWFALHMARV